MFKPLNGRVLLKPDEAEKTTSFGIIIPETGQEKPLTGVIVVGGDMTKEGDHVLYSKYGYDEVKVDGETYYVIFETSILGVF